MKTIFKSLLFVSLLAWIPPVLGQSYSTIAENAGNYYPTKTIVRTWERGNSALSYVRENGCGCLYLINVDDMATESVLSLMTLTGRKFDLPNSDMEVNDIQILEDRAYVCGHEQNKAFYGYVDFPLPPVPYFYYCYVNPTDTISLKKMVVYKDTGRGKLVAIGEHFSSATPVNKWEDEIFEIDDPASSSPSCTTYSLPYASNDKREGLYDLVLTDDYVVFIGYESTVPVPLCTRWADRSNIMGTINDRYLYNLPMDEINGKLLATVVDSAKWISIVYIHDKDGYHFTTRTRMIDIQGATHDLIYSQEYVVGNKTEPYGITYNPSQNTLTVLQNSTASLGNTEFRLLDPFPTISYNFNYLYFKYPVVEFTSLYKYDNSHYIATGLSPDGSSKCWYMQDVTAPFSPLMTCPFLSSDKASVLSSEVGIYDPQTPTSLSSVLNDNPVPCLISSATPTAICNIPYVK